MQPGNGGSYDAVVMKLNATATALVYATYLGGSFDAFVVKLDAGATTRVYSTYHGGTDYDEAWAIAVDAAGNAHVTARHGRATSPP